MTHNLVDKYLSKVSDFPEYEKSIHRTENELMIKWEIPIKDFPCLNLKYQKDCNLYETYFGEKHKNFDLLNEIKKIFKTHPKCKIIRVVLQNNEDELYCLETSEVKIACIFAFNANQKDLNMLD